jgi:Putative prokaryotic signal transducing protein
MTELKLVTVYVSQGMLSAQVVRGKLESAGIPVLLKYEAIGQIIGLTVDGLGSVEVQVPEEYAADAEYLLQEEDVDGEPEGGFSPTE